MWKKVSYSWSRVLDAKRLQPSFVASLLFFAKKRFDGRVDVLFCQGGGVETERVIGFTRKFVHESVTPAQWQDFPGNPATG